MEGAGASASGVPCASACGHAGPAWANLDTWRMGTSGGGVIPSGLGVEWAAYLRADRGDGGDGGQLALWWRGRLGGGLEQGAHQADTLEVTRRK